MAEVQSTFQDVAARSMRPHSTSCPTCGTALRGRRTFCSDTCRPACELPGCARTCTGRALYCGVHMSSIYRYGRLPEYEWAADKMCVVCKQPHSHPSFRKVCSQKCQQLLHRNGGAAPDRYKQCAICPAIIDLHVVGRAGRKKRADTKVCDSCYRAKYVRHRVSVTVLAERDGTACGICGDPVDMGLAFPDLFRASVDHVIPFAESGSHAPENLQLTHLWCNLVKSNRTGFTL